LQQAALEHRAKDLLADLDLMHRHTAGAAAVDQAQLVRLRLAQKPETAGQERPTLLLDLLLFTQAAAAEHQHLVELILAALEGPAAVATVEMQTVLELLERSTLAAAVVAEAIQVPQKLLVALVDLAW